ncbi:FUSC family protein [Streptomyces mangrovisoli]|uniref:FUSC family protein n=1 Tax=Streptomyces mangrovisoli TaxID=1428628 RepID=A0A1J4NJZ4_9ACTN|nr:FUSC family protein [Streptomyces mangrovisoli]
MRVTLAATVAFLFFRYGLNRPVPATYALFSVVALGGLSKIPGTGRQRAAVVLRMIPVCWLLIVVGTYLSVRTWTAVVGMLIVGFALAFSAIGGPRPAGAAPGLQLLYILPSFPPYDPSSLDDRLLGTTVGLALLVLSEALIFPEPAPPAYRDRAASAARTAAHCATLLAEPPYALTDDDILSARTAGRSLRSMSVPEAERPAGPGTRDRALTHTGLAERTLLTRLSEFRTPSAPGPGPGPAVTSVLEAVARLSTATATRLTSGPSPLAPYGELIEARARLAALSAGPTPPQTSAQTQTQTQTPAPAPDSRPAGPSAPAPAASLVSAGSVSAQLAAAPAPAAEFPPAVLRRHAATLEIADAALAMAAAADLAAGGRRCALPVPTGRFWYADDPAPMLWWHRVRGHAGRRSVFFQNAVRLALALTAARLVAGLDTLPHGFWAMLATLTLTRTTMDETRTTIRRALTGTLAGALVVAATLTLVGSHTLVYAVVLPVWMLFAFTVGPVKGVGWAQGLFTVLVALVFAQLEASSWQLAGVRVLDVLIGSTIGAVFGLLAWPRGAHDELRHAAADLLRRAAEIVVATGASVADGAVAAPAGVPGHLSLRRAVILAESAYAQFQSEPTLFGGRAGGRPLPQIDWQATLMAGHHTLWGSERLLQPPVTELDEGAAETLNGWGDRVAGRMLLVSAALDPGSETPAARVPVFGPHADGCKTEPPGAPRLYYATVSWLDALMRDLTRIPRGGPGPQRS